MFCPFVFPFQSFWNPKINSINLNIEAVLSKALKWKSYHHGTLSDWFWLYSCCCQSFGGWFWIGFNKPHGILPVFTSSLKPLVSRLCSLHARCVVLTLKCCRWTIPCTNSAGLYLSWRGGHGGFHLSWILSLWKTKWLRSPTSQWQWPLMERKIR